MRLAIIGHGFVGQAVDFGFTKVGIKKALIDPKYGTQISDLVDFQPDLIFIAVPTPMSEDGKINVSILVSVMNELQDLGFGRHLIAIKSTVTPDIIDGLAQDFPNLVYNPEFLTERNFKNDFIHPPMHIFGSHNDEASQKLFRYYLNFSICDRCPVHFVDPKAASLAKYTINSFLASKVIFFNYMREIFDRSGTTTDYDTWTNILKCDTRMGHSHFDAPGPDGKLGYGGTCFPKDTNALYKYSESLGVSHHLLSDVIWHNEEFRNESE